MFLVQCREEMARYGDVFAYEILVCRFHAREREKQVRFSFGMETTVARVEKVVRKVDWRRTIAGIDERRK